MQRWIAGDTLKRFLQAKLEEQRQRTQEALPVGMGVAAAAQKSMSYPRNTTSGYPLSHGFTPNHPILGAFVCFWCFCVIWHTAKTRFSVLKALAECAKLSEAGRWKEQMMRENSNLAVVVGSPFGKSCNFSAIGLAALILQSNYVYNSNDI